MSTLNKSEQYLMVFLAFKGVSIKSQQIHDFQLIGDETEEKVREYANDYLSELQSERSEAAAFKRYPESIDPVNY